ncbi:probable cytochrome P450 304a1 isoform X2 [Battus philenor]|uniref:probable cytochrome P450 304a1 isoform X2 n=1 Tax=Battus philenor TaxID=42288 RepID=UPI0035CF87E2
MIGAIVIVFIFIFTVVQLYKNAYKRPHKFPPGPPSLPVYGAYWLLLAKSYNNLADACIKYSKEYKSKVIGMFLGDIPAVVVNDPKLLREVLTREEFDGRTDTITSRLRSYWKKLGIFFTDGYFWHVQRRFTLRYMRDYGFGRRDQTLESTIAHETKEMIDMAVNGPKYPAEKDLVKEDLIHLPHFFAAPFMNGIIHVFTRSTVPRADYHVLWSTARGALTFQRSSNDLGAALAYTPWLKDVLPVYSGYKGLKEGNQCVLDLVTKVIDEALHSHDQSYERHFLDVYIKKMKEERKLMKKTTYSVDQLALICTDYMFPTATALGMVICFLIEQMLLHPEVQEKIHEEIDRVVGRDRSPTLDDRSKMPYTEACLREMMRFETIVPLGVAHRSMSETNLDGYVIPEAGDYALEKPMPVRVYS